VFREISGAPRSLKPPALIVVRNWIYYFGTYKPVSLKSIP
jgi:hypothetical protein